MDLLNQLASRLTAAQSGKSAVENNAFRS
ncbi:VENN motif pre-toxin domain-containing protein [Pasteurellaceae bacterium 20609_3]|nr:VENN motif pre-toxin domain-containing protein [Spirabiliibacterium mucosae]